MINSSFEIQDPSTVPSNRRRLQAFIIQLLLFVLPPILATLVSLPRNNLRFWQWLLLYAPSAFIVCSALYTRFQSQRRPRTVPSVLAVSILVLALSQSFQGLSEQPRSDFPPAVIVSVDNWEKLLQLPPAPRKLQKEYDFKNELAVVIVIRDEEEFISKTISYVLEETPNEILREIIVVDDASTLAASKYLTNSWIDRTLKAYNHSLDKIQIVRFNQKQGLIRAKIAGAELSVSPNIFFLDGHCRLDKLWYQPLLDRVNPNLVDDLLDGEVVPAYKRIIIPEIYDIDRVTWEDKNTFGLKMMFDWTFEFDWFEDDSDLVPILPGGIELITRKWWEESGRYDSGMLEWGGENIEQSLRCWLCGGGILQTNTSRIGHIFDRPPKPNPNNQLVIQVQKNQKRAAIVWLDDYYQYLDKFHTSLKKLDPGQGLEYRQFIRTELGCKPFRWFVRKFKSTFQRRGLLIHEYHAIQHKRSKLCLTAQHDQNRLSLEPCARSAKHQLWSAIVGDRFIHNLGTMNCLTKITKSNKMILAECGWLKMLKNLNHDQFWQYDDGKIFTERAVNTRSKDGNDRVKATKKDYCLSGGLVAIPCTRLGDSDEWQVLW